MLTYFYTKPISNKNKSPGDKGEKIVSTYLLHLLHFLFLKERTGGGTKRGFFLEVSAADATSLERKRRAGI